MRTKWTNEPDVFHTEIEEPLPFAASGELSIHYLNSGYYDSGCMYLRNGDPGYPPEGDNEIQLDYATLDGVKLDKETAQAAFDHFVAHFMSN